MPFFSCSAFTVCLHCKDNGKCTALASLAELLRRLPCMFLEKTGEILRILEAKGVGYLADGVIGRGEAAASLGYEVIFG